jgi:copper chaperone CopZ
MKSLKKIMIAAIVLLSIPSAFAQLSRVDIVATGLTCSMCSNAINKQLKTLTDVEKVDIDLNTNTFVVFLKKSNQITPKILKDKVENAGFFVGEMVLYMYFDKQKTIMNSAVSTNNLTFIFIDNSTRTLEGETKLKVFDKGYITSKAFKKVAKLIKYDGNNAIEKGNVYHVKIV